MGIEAFPRKDSETIRQELTTVRKETNKGMSSAGSCRWIWILFVGLLFALPQLLYVCAEVTFAQFAVTLLIVMQTLEKPAHRVKGDFRIKVLYLDERKEKRTFSFWMNTAFMDKSETR